MQLPEFNIGIAGFILFLLSQIILCFAMFTYGIATVRNDIRPGCEEAKDCFIFGTIFISIYLALLVSLFLVVF